jgi:hypothetical protein
MGLEKRLGKRAQNKKGQHKGPLNSKSALAQSHAQPSTPEPADEPANA